MKTLNMFEARNHFSQTLKEAKKDLVIVTLRGKPVAAIQGITEDDMEDFLLERSPKFWKMIETARRCKAVSLEAVKRKLRI